MSMIPTHLPARRLLQAGLASLTLLLSAGQLWAVESPATIAYVEGVVLLKRKNEDKPVQAEIGMSVFRGDTVQTAAGKCQINMTAAGILRLSPNTTAHFPVEDNRGDKIGVVKMLKGKTWQNIQGLWTNEVFEVRDPVLVAGVSDQRSPDVPHGPQLPNRDGEIERLRAEGNARLAAIRAELKGLEGQPVSIGCPSCGEPGPHRWTTDGWECNCGATPASFGNYPTSHGRYNEVRDDYRRRIEALESLNR